MSKKKRKRSPEDPRTKVMRILASEEEYGDFPLAVQLYVGGDDSIAAEIRTNLEDEFDALEDVIVTDVNPRYRIFIAVMNGPEPIFAVVTADSLGLESGSSYGSVLKALLSERLSEQEMDAANQIASKHDHVCNIWIIKAPSGDILQLCEETVERVDREILEPDRLRLGR